VERDRALLVIEEMSKQASVREKLKEIKNLREKLKEKEMELEELKIELEDVKENAVVEIDSVMEDMNDAKKERAVVKRLLTKEEKTNKKISKETTILRSALEVARYNIPTTLYPHHIYPHQLHFHCARPLSAQT
jgi:L-lactate utilization protein LutB